MLAIETNKLTKKFKEKTAVNEINLKINEGELFALLGTNGAGKTTTIKMLSTLILPTEGEIKILGLDIVKDRQKIKEILNVSPQETAIAPNLSVKENFAKVGSKEEIDKAFREVTKFAKDFIEQYSPKKNKKTHIDGAEVYHPSYLGNIKVTSEIKVLIKQHRLGSSGGTDIHVDKTLGDDESVSSDSLGGHVTKNKLRKYGKLRKRAIGITKLRNKTRDNNNKER